MEEKWKVFFVSCVEFGSSKSVGLSKRSFVVVKCFIVWPAGCRTLLPEVFSVASYCQWLVVFLFRVGLIKCHHC